jgi:YidC/Oxa1 family membrane protein insertase
MDNQRLLVWAAFGILLWLTYQTWMQDYGPSPVPVEQPAGAEPVAATPADDQLTLPELGETVDQPGEPGAVLPGSEPAGAADQGAIINVRTDVLELQISARGGTLMRAKVLGYPMEKDRPDELVELLSPEQNALGLIRTGLRSAGGASADQDTVFSSPRGDYELGDADELVVPLSWTIRSCYAARRSSSDRCSTWTRIRLTGHRPTTATRPKSTSEMTCKRRGRSSTRRRTAGWPPFSTTS